jgi:four helix bundle protein
VSQIRSYRDLIAWQRAMALAEMTYHQTRALPRDERVGLQSQMRRAAVSIPSNIAEGYARQSKRDYLCFLRTARGSVAELSTQLELAERLGLVKHSQRLLETAAEVDRILGALIDALKRSKRA